MKPMRVLHIVSVDKENYYLHNLVDHSSSDKVEFSFVTFAGECEFGRSLEKRGQRVFYLDSPKRNQYPRALKKLWSILTKETPDIVHTHLFDASLIGLTMAKMQRRKTVLTRHHSDAIHQIASPSKRRFYLGLEKYISRLSDHIIAPSQMVRDFLVEREGVPDKKVAIIPYGQTTERFDCITPEAVDGVRRELGMDGTIAMVNVSRLFHRKGHMYLFEAFAGLLNSRIDAKLYLVGDGEYREVLERMCSDLGISERVKFLGWRDDALTVVAAADIVVHPSLEDALSSAVIEAVMLEKPIVATDISGVRDSLGDGRYGRIVPPEDSESIRGAIEEVLADIDAATKIASRGRQYLLQYMDAGRVANEHLMLYQSLSGNG